MTAFPCPSGYDAIADEAGCSTAATALGKTYRGVASDGTDRPEGCYSLNGKSMWFNKRPVSWRNGIRGFNACQKASGGTTSGGTTSGGATSGGTTSGSTTSGTHICSDVWGGVSSTYPCKCGLTTAAVMQCSIGQLCTASNDNDGTCQAPPAPTPQPTPAPTPEPTPEPNTEATCDETLRGNKDADYRGCQTITRSGKTCQEWTSQTPHRHRNSPTDKPGKGLGDHNYCRNPDGSATIWCYTTSSTRWEYCDPKASTPWQSCTPSEAAASGCDVSGACGRVSWGCFKTGHHGTGCAYTNAGCCGPSTECTACIAGGGAYHPQAGATTNEGGCITTTTTTAAA